MKTVVYRALVAASLALALPCAAQVSVVGCIYDSTVPHVTDDPNRCPAERKLDIVSIKTSWTQSSAAAASPSTAVTVRTSRGYVARYRRSKSSRTPARSPANPSPTGSAF